MEMVNLPAFAAFALLFVAAITGQTPFCYNLEPVTNADYSFLQGRWFGLYYLSQGVRVIDMKCLEEHLQITPEGILTANTTLINGKTNETIITTYAGKTVDSLWSKYSYRTNFYAENANNSEIFIIATDNNHYIIWVTCRRTIDDTVGFVLMVNSKQTTLSSETLNKVMQDLRANNITDRLTSMDQHTC